MTGTPDGYNSSNDDFVAAMQGGAVDRVGGAPPAPGNVPNEEFTAAPPSQEPEPAPAPAPADGAWIDDETFQKFKADYPEIAQEFHNRTTKAKGLEGSRDHLQTQMAQMREEMLDLTRAIASNKQEAPKEGIDGIPSDALMEYVSDYDNMVRAAALDPENGELRERVAGLDARKVEAVRSELMNRKVQEQVGALRNEFTEQNKVNRLQMSTAAVLAQDLGQGEDQQAGLSAAQTAVFDAAKSLGLSNQDVQGLPQEAASLIAVLGAKLASSNRGEGDSRFMDPTVARSLGQEGAPRVVRGTPAPTRATRGRGSYDEQLDAWYAHNFGI